MTNATNELARFHQFVGEQLQHPDSAELSPEAALALWRDQAETLTAIREGLADIEAGRTIPLDQFVREFRERHHLANPQ